MTTTGPLAIVGPTASGKTAASIVIAEALGGEIVSVDPALVYRGMDVWTSKPSARDRRRVAHHMIDLMDPVEPIGVQRFQELAREAIAGIGRRGAPVVLVGASGLTFRAVVDGFGFPGTDARVRGLLAAEAVAIGPERLHERLRRLDPAAAGRIHPANARRTVRALEVPAITGNLFSSYAKAWDRFDRAAVRVAGIRIERTVLHERIERRVRDRFPALLRETEFLLDGGFGRFVRSGHVIGYAEAAAHLDGRIGADEAASRVVRRDKALARRQLSWFRRDPRVVWFDAGRDGALEVADELLRYLRGADEERTASAVGAGA